MAKTKKKKTVKRCVEMFTDELSIVNRGANGHSKWLMVKAEDGGEIGQIVEDVEKAVPKKDASKESKEKAQSARSKKYGIEILPKNSNLSYPSGAPTTERLYGDPVNLKYPLAYEGETKPDPARTRNAISRFKGNYQEYSKKSSQARVYERIVRAAMAAGIDVSFDPDNPVDKLLPGDIKTRLKKNDDGPDADPASAETDAADDAEESTAEDWLDGITKSIEDQNSDDWLTEAQSAIDFADGSPGTESVKKGDGEPDETPATVAKSDTSETTETLEALQKESKEKDSKIEMLEKSVTTLKAEVGRLSTSIGSAQSVRPGSSANNDDATPDPCDALNSSIDLSPALTK